MSIDTEVLWLDEQGVVTLTELMEFSGLRETELVELAQTGVFPVREAPDGGLAFSARVVSMARTACRLRDDFDLDVSGLGVALRLLERVRDLEGEIARLRARLPRD